MLGKACCIYTYTISNATRRDAMDWKPLETASSQKLDFSLFKATAKKYHILVCKKSCLSLSQNVSSISLMKTTCRNILLLLMITSILQRTLSDKLDADC